MKITHHRSASESKSMQKNKMVQHFPSSYNEAKDIEFPITQASHLTVHLENPQQVPPLQNSL